MSSLTLSQVRNGLPSAAAAAHSTSAAAKRRGLTSTSIIAGQPSRRSFYIIGKRAKTSNRIEKGAFHVFHRPDTKSMTAPLEIVIFAMVHPLLRLFKNVNDVCAQKRAPRHPKQQTNNTNHHQHSNSIAAQLHGVSRVCTHSRHPRLSFAPFICDCVPDRPPARPTDRPTKATASRRVCGTRDWPTRV